MNDIKLSLTVILPGRVIASGEESPVNSTMEHVEVYNEVSKRMETIKIYMQKAKPAQQHINLSSETYKNMISATAPRTYKDSAQRWKQMKKGDRLVWHLQDIAASLGGELMSYHIFED